METTVDLRLLDHFRRSRRVNGLLRRAETNRRAAVAAPPRAAVARPPVRALELRD